MYNIKSLLTLLTHKMYIRKIGIPVWATALALLAIAGTAAQAIGPVLSGNITGNIGAAVAGGGGVTVSGSIVLATGDDAKTTVEDAADFVMAVSDDGTAFTAAIEANEGTTFSIQLDIDNLSDKLAFAFLTVIAPSDFTLNAEELIRVAVVPATIPPTFTPETADFDSHGFSAAQFNADTWLVTVPALEDGGDKDLEITIKGKPGFHTVRVVIRQFTPPG